MSAHTSHGLRDVKHARMLCLHLDGSKPLAVMYRRIGCLGYAWYDCAYYPTAASLRRIMHMRFHRCVDVTGAGKQYAIADICDPYTGEVVAHVGSYVDQDRYDHIDALGRCADVRTF